MSYLIIHLHRRPGFVVRKVGDAHMVIPTGPRMKEYQGVITINETAAFLFELVKEEKTPDMLVEALIAEYGIDFETAMTAVTAFVDQCSNAKLLVTDEVEELSEDKHFIMADAMNPDETEPITIDMRENDNGTDDPAAE